MNIFRTIEQAGFLIAEIQDGPSDAPIYKRELVAQCASHMCCGRNFVRKKTKPVKNRSEMWCPDCGHALVWSVKKVLIKK